MCADKLCDSKNYFEDSINNLTAEKKMLHKMTSFFLLLIKQKGQAGQSGELKILDRGPYITILYLRVLLSGRMTCKRR